TLDYGYGSIPDWKVLTMFGTESLRICCSAPPSPDPCVLSEATGKLTLNSTPICPRRDENGNLTHFLIRGTRVDGSRVTIDNDAYSKIVLDEVKKIYHYTFEITRDGIPDYEEWLIAAECVNPAPPSPSCNC
ncbi:hypothetical protein PFISCL1PPCAC_17871, partial [Pristionchus fissidentatus]